MTSSAAGESRQLGPTRRRVLAHLQNEVDPAPIEALSQALDLHHNTIRFHLEALVSDGLVRRVVERRDRQGRPRVLFTAEPSIEPVSNVPYRALVEALLAHVRDTDGPGHVLAEQIGENWGRSLAGEDSRTIEDLVATVTGLGMSSRLVQDDDGARLEIVRCPFRELTVYGDRTACWVHLGMMRGYLAAGGADTTVTELLPWVTTELCLAHLGPVDGAAN